MKIRIPVYQMTIGKNELGHIGLFFPTEQATFESHNMLYVVPIIKPFTNIIAPIIPIEIYFPFEMEKQYYELEAKINFPELYFSIPYSEITITFKFNLSFLNRKQLFPFKKRGGGKVIRYLGKQSQVIPPNDGFLAINPIELKILDDLYLKYKGVFVGYTPNFGKIDLESFSKLI